MTRGTRSSARPAISERTARVRGASGDPARGAYCTPRYVADALGEIHLDPFTNARSHVRSALACQLERGDDGFGEGDPGTFVLRELVSSQRLPQGIQAIGLADGRWLCMATHSTRTWLQPDYTEVLRCVRHYLHTRFVALLRFDPRPEWQDLIGGASSWIGVLSNSPGRSSFEFEPAPGVVASSNTFPHALYARHYADVTPAMLKLCSYPDGTARHWRKRSALDGAGARDWLRSWGLDASVFNLST